MKENKSHRRAGSSDAISTVRDGTEVDNPPENVDDADQLENNTADDMNDVDMTQETDRSNGNDIGMEDAAPDDIYESGVNGTSHMDTETEPNQNDDTNNLDSQVSGQLLREKRNNFSSMCVSCRIYNIICI